VLESGKHHVIVGRAEAAKCAHAVDKRVLRGILNVSESGGVVVVHKMAPEAAHIADVRDQRVPQIVLHVEREVFGVLGGHVIWQAAEVRATCFRQTGVSGRVSWVKRRNGVGICRVAVVIVRTGRDRIDDIGVDVPGSLLAPGIPLVPGGLPSGALAFAICSPLKFRPKPPRTTSLPLKLSGLQLKPNCGPKFSFCAVQAPIPVRIVIPVKRSLPVPKESTPMLLFLSVSGPK